MSRYQRWASLTFVLFLWTPPLGVMAQHNSSNPTFPQPSPPTIPQPQQTGALERADALNQQAIELYQAGRYDEALPLVEEALAIRREQLGESHPDVALALNNLAELYSSQARYEEAIPIFQQALAIWREHFGEGDPRFALALGNLAELHRIQGRYAEAESLARQSLAILQGFFGESAFSAEPNFNILAATYLSRSLHNLAAIYAEQGRYGEAEPLYLQSLEISRGQLGHHHPHVAQSLNNLARLYRLQGRYQDAEPLYLEALDTQREQFGEHHPAVANSLNNLAVLYEVQGRYAEAEALYQQSLAISREMLGARHPEVANSLDNLARLYLEQGRYAEAEPIFLDALEILREQLGDRHPEVAQSLNNLAGLYLEQGRYADAEPLYRQSLAIRREQLGDGQGPVGDHRHPEVAQSLNNLAVVYRLQGRYAEAEPLYTRALEIRREQLGDGHPDVAFSLNSLALLYDAQGRYEAAAAFYQDALDIRREQLGDRHPLVATSLHNLAGLHYGQGRYGEAQALLQQSLSIYQAQLGDRHPLVATNLNNLFVTYHVQDERAEALQALATALAIEEWHLDLNLAVLSDAQRQDYIADLATSTDAALSLHLQLSPPEATVATLALTTVLRRKGRILDAGVNSLQSLRQNLSAVDQALLDELTTTRQQLATLTFNPPSLPNPTQYQAELTRLETTANQLEGQLARRSAAFRAETQPVELAAVQAQLPPNSVLVEYIRYQPLDATHPQNPWGADRYAAYLLFPNGDIQAVDLGDAAAIDAATQAFLRLLQDPSATLRAGARPVRRPENVAAISQTLKTLILDPIAPYLQSTDHLLISPDSQLNRLPFEALQAETGGPFLIEQYQISYLNSGRDLLKFNVTEPSQAPAVVLANPDYDSASNSPLPSLGEGTGPALSEVVGVRALGTGERASGQRSANLSQLQVGPLPGTAAEAEAIQSLLPNATIWTEGQATENALKQVQAPRILHIATHGFFLANVERPQAAGSRGLGIQSFSSALTPSTSAASLTENPLLRSGLALAGFNPRRSGDEDGVLTALEASALNLLGTQLVVLSACDTGLGDIANGEGVYGLRRAFAMAGAETQLISLWQVDDFGTQSLMGQYYEQLLSGKGRAEALREVQLAMINSGSSYSHPYYWAAFIVTGDWRPLD